MKKSLKNETDMLESINKIQALLTVLDKKVDALMRRPVSEVSPSTKPPVNNTNDDRNKGRVMHKAICADCKKECSLPFKPSGDRPVYCQDCFSRRKVIKMSGITVADKPKEVSSLQAQVKTKKKAVTVKKPIGKKKPVPKKK
jgi:CxxC-x17-CxxC domain-containing protein